MKDSVLENSIQQTSDYDRFKIIESNRTLKTEHIQNLIKSLTERPDMLKSRPILVNQKWEIIDGQHRFEASKELKLPIYYVMGKGLGIAEAQRLNSIQRNWNLDDFARSYAMEGHEQYQRFLEWKKEFGMPFSILRLYCEGYERKRGNESFKRGDFKMMKDKKLIYQRLEMLSDLADIFPHWRYRSFGTAMLEAFKNDTYDHDLFVEKFRMRGEHELNNFYGSKNDYLRAIENIYNYRTDIEKQIRLF